MKRLLTLTLILLTFAGVMVPRQVEACDRATYTLDSIVVSGSNYLLYTTLCIGSGINGTLTGADQNTGRFFFGFFDADPGFLVLGINPTSVTPALYPSTTSYSTAGAQCPPGSNPLNTDCFIQYNPTTPGRWFACKDNAVSCGDTATQCFPFVWTVNQIPDSIRAMGIEGGNVTTNGCYPNADMNINFLTLPVVWGSFVGSPSEAGVTLNWVTHNDLSTTNYLITRSLNGSDFEQIGSIVAKPTGDMKYGEYEFFDPNPKQGVNYYRLVQTNEAGQLSSSEVVQVTFNAPNATAWNFVSPVPSQDYVTLSFRSPANQNFALSVYDSKGNVVHTAQISALMGTTDRVIDMSSWESGFYFIRLHGADGSVLDKKIVKI